MAKVNRYQVTVKNLENEKVHFSRVVELPEDVAFPYNSITRSLLFLYTGLNISVDFSINTYVTNLILK